MSNNRIINSELTDSEISEYAGALKLLDLHRHLEGCISPEMMIDLSERFNIALPSHDVEILKPYIQVTEDDTSLIDFLKKFDVIGKSFVSNDAIEYIAEHAVLDAHRDSVSYLELRFSPFYMAESHGSQPHAPEDVMEAVISGVQQAVKNVDIKVNLIAIAGRELGIEKARQIAHLASRYQDQGVVGFDLAGDEANFPPLQFAESFKIARDAGLQLTVHAGEAAGPEHVITAIVDLQANRIGHGVRSYLDQNAMDLLIKTGIPLELCITSNLDTHAIKSLSSYPLRRYIDEGIVLTLNSDDPAVSGITLSSEIALAVRKFDLTFTELRTIIESSVDYAFVSDSEREELRKIVRKGFCQADRVVRGLK